MATELYFIHDTVNKSDVVFTEEREFVPTRFILRVGAKFGGRVEVWNHIRDEMLGSCSGGNYDMHATALWIGLHELFPRVPAMGDPAVGRPAVIAHYADHGIKVWSETDALWALP